MKLAYLANIRFPSDRAHSAQIAHMCQAFAENGHDVTLCVNKRARENLFETGIMFGFVPKFKMVRFRPRRIFPSLQMSFIVGEFWFAWQVYLHNRHSEFDLIYTRNEWVAWVLSFIISSNKIMWESHEAKYSFPVREILRKEIKVVVISKGISDSYLAKGVSSDQLFIADDAIDDSFFCFGATKEEARQTLGLPQNNFIVMYIGGLSEWKGVHTFLQASQLVSQALFAVIGGGTKEITELQKEYPQVQFLGQRPYRELSTNQQAADALVIPNTAKNALSASYTSPLKLFAHMASGVPLVVSNIPSLTQVTPVELVTTFTPDDANDLATKISLIQNEYSCKKQRAKKLVETAKLFTWKNRAQNIITFYTCGV